MYYVYAHYDETGVRYIGKGCRLRATSLLRNIYWRRIFKYVKPRVIILASGLSEDDAYRIEAEVIKQAKENGARLCNLTDGGGGMSGYVASKETRSKLSAMRKGSLHWNYGRKIKAHVLEAMIKGKEGKPAPWSGKQRDENTRAKARETFANPENRAKALAKQRANPRKQSAEERALRSEQLRAQWAAGERTVRPEVVAKLVEAGRTRVRVPNSEASKAKLSETRKRLIAAGIIKTDHVRKAHEALRGKPSKKRKPVVCEDTGETFEHAMAAADQKGLNVKHIQACCSGRRATHGGLRWSYQ